MNRRHLLVARDDYYPAYVVWEITLRCDHACPYCQVSRVSEDRQAYDMSPEVADRAVDLMFGSPS